MVLPGVYNSVNMITPMITGAVTARTLLVIVIINITTTIIMSTRIATRSRKLMMFVYLRIMLPSVIPGRKI